MSLHQLKRIHAYQDEPLDRVVGQLDYWWIEFEGGSARLNFAGKPLAGKLRATGREVSQSKPSRPKMFEAAILYPCEFEDQECDHRALGPEGKIEVLSEVFADQGLARPASMIAMALREPQALGARVGFHIGQRPVLGANLASYGAGGRDTSELVRDREAAFLTFLSQVQVPGLEETDLVEDSTPRSRCVRLFSAKTTLKYTLPCRPSHGTWTQFNLESAPSHQRVLAKQSLVSANRNKRLNNRELYLS